MKQLIKRMIPNRMMPMAQRLYQRFFNNSATDFPKQQYDSIKALKCTVSYNQYGKYCVPESSCHRPAARKILSNHVYEPKTIEFMTANCGNGDIVHAGTYFGDFLPALSKKCTPNSKVWAFEPNSENYRCATITLEINDIRNVVLINARLGAQKKCLLMKMADENGRALGGASWIIAQNLSEVSGTETVQIVTVDDTVGIDRAVSIIQLDIEGYEEEALKGAIKTIQRCLPIIILEALPNSTLLGSDWFAENILSLGYSMISTLHGNSVFICESKN